jgi:predicted kinase
VNALPVIWLCGAPGTGKSTVAWRLFHDFADRSIRVGYVDVDQLGMLCPAPKSDPDRHQAKADALTAVMPNYAQAGARLFIVSGVLDPVVGARVAARLPSISFCHLKAEVPTVRARLADRDPQQELAEDAISMMRGLDQASFISHTVDTDGRTPQDIAREVAPLVKPLAEAPSTAGADAAQGDGDLTVVSGPRAVGKSSVSWQLFTQKCASGVATAYADLEQLGLLPSTRRRGRHSPAGLEPGRALERAAAVGDPLPHRQRTTRRRGRKSPTHALRLGQCSPCATHRLR